VRKKLVFDGGDKRAGRSGRMSIVWELVREMTNEC